MRVHILSDLHLEFGPAEIPQIECDCVILAGDISTKLHGLEWILDKFPDVPVIYVCGNHEFYGERHPHLIEKLRHEAKGTNVHVLENNWVYIQGVPIFGCTLWSDMALQGNVMTASLEAAGSMNDYKRIRNSSRGYRRFSPLDSRMAHSASLAAMKEFFAQHEASNSIIVTHHAPSIRSLPESRQGLLISAAYTSHLDDFIREHQPALWVHGHIHHSNDYTIGQTRIISNPRAYPDESNPEFRPDLVVELVSS